MLFRSGVYGIGVGGLDRAPRHAEFSRHRLEPRCIPAGEKDAAAGSDDQSGDGRPDASAAAENENALAHGYSQSPTVCSSLASAAMSRSLSIARV